MKEFIPMNPSIQRITLPFPVLTLTELATHFRKRRFDPAISGRDKGYREAMERHLRRELYETLEEDVRKQFPKVPFEDLVFSPITFTEEVPEQHKDDIYMMILEGFIEASITIYRKELAYEIAYIKK